MVSFNKDMVMYLSEETIVKRIHHVNVSILASFITKNKQSYTSVINQGGKCKFCNLI